MTACPVCEDHSKADADAAMAIVISGARAILTHDPETVETLFPTLTGYDAHIAISLYAIMLTDYCSVVGGDPIATLDYYRENLHAQIASE
jgi:hypothetical protein